MKQKIKSGATNYLTGHFPHHETNSPVLVVSELGYRYKNTWTLEKISFELAAGERIAVVGPNGAGKSTLFKLIAGVIRPLTGLINIYGHEPVGHICIAYVAQRSLVDWSFPVSVADVVMMGRVSKVGLLRWPSGSDWDVVYRALNSVDLGQLRQRQINELSGGQQQRVFIARALAQEAQLILMDEPFTGLDITSQEELFAILDRLKAQGVTVMIAMHDLKLASERFDRVMLLNHLLLGVGVPETVFVPKNLTAAYGGHMRMIKTEDGLFVLEDTCCEEGGHQHA